MGQDPDGASFSVQHAAFPYWVFIDAQGQVAFRHSGQIPPADLASAIETLGGLRASEPSP